MNSEGISIHGSLLDLAIQYNLIGKSGTFFKIEGKNIQGREATKRFLKDNPKIAEKLTKQIWEIIRNPQIEEAETK